MIINECNECLLTKGFSWLYMAEISVYVSEMKAMSVTVKGYGSFSLDWTTLLMTL